MKYCITILFFFPFILHAQKIKSVYKYQDIIPFSRGLARVERNGKFGFINKDGEEVIPCKFYDAYPFSNHHPLAMVKDSMGNIGFINVLGDLVVEPKYSEFYYWDTQTGFAYVMRDGYYGFINENGKEIIQCMFRQTHGTPESFFNGIAQMKKDYYYGIIDSSGKTLVNFEYDEFVGFDWLDGFPKNYLGATKGSERFFISMKDYKVSKVNYDEIETFSNGMAAVKKNGKYGYVDTSLSLAIPCIYDSAMEFHNGFAAVQNDSGKWGYVSKDGKLAIACLYDGAEIFNCGRAMVKKEEKAGFIDTSGKEVVPFEFDFNRIDDYNYKHVDGYEDSICAIRKGKKYGIIDIDGNTIQDFIYDKVFFVNDFSLWSDFGFPREGNYAQAKKRKKLYPIDKQGKRIGTYFSKVPIYFSEGKAFICKSKNKCGFINPDGKLVVPFQFDAYESSIFYNNYCMVKKNNKMGLVDNNGKIIIPLVYKNIYPFNEGLALGYTEDKFLFIDKEGNVQLEMLRGGF